MNTMRTLKLQRGASHLLVLMLLSALMVMALWWQGDDFAGLARLNAIVRQDMQQSLWQQNAWRQFVTQDLPLLKQTAQHDCRQLTSRFFNKKDQPNFERLQNFPKNSSLAIKQDIPKNLQGWRNYFQQKAQQSLWCKARTLFSTRPKGKMENSWQVINPSVLNDYLTAGQIIPTATSASEPLRLNKAAQPFYFLNQKHNFVDVQGKVKTVIVSRGNVQFTGKGIVRGAVVAQGAITTKGRISFRYNKAIVDRAMNTYAQWQLDLKRFTQIKQRGWNDF